MGPGERYRKGPDRSGMPVLSVVLQKIGIEARLWKALHQFDIEKGGGI